MSKYLHPIPGMKFSTTSANSSTTNKIYNYIYKIYEVAQFLQKVYEKIDTPIIPNKMNEVKKKTLRKQISTQSYSTLSFLSAPTTPMSVKYSNRYYQSPGVTNNSTINPELSKEKPKNGFVDAGKYMSMLNTRSTKQLLKSATSNKTSFRQLDDTDSIFDYPVERANCTSMFIRNAIGSHMVNKSKKSSNTSKTRKSDQKTSDSHSRK